MITTQKSTELVVVLESSDNYRAIYFVILPCKCCLDPTQKSFPYPGSRSRSKTNRSRYERFERFSARFERFERFGRFFGTTAQTAQILLKKPLKNRSFLAVIFERFFKQDLSGFRAIFERSYKENRLKPTKRPVKVMWPRVDIHKPKMLILNFPHRKSLSYNCLHQMYGKMLIIQFAYNFKKPLKKDSI